jgi:ribonucleoside-triphosphate reductase
MIVIKKTGKFDYDDTKIQHAITQAWNQIGYPDFNKINDLVNVVNILVQKEAKNNKKDEIEVERIENFVMSVLYSEVPDVAREYSAYKMDKERAIKNPTEIEKVLYVNPEIEHENGNKNPHLVHIKNAYLAEIPSKEMMRKLLPKDCLDAHDRCVVKFHDFSYSARAMFNCCNWNLEEMFKGCNINGIYIETPKSFKTACTVASQALTHATSSQYGGITINLLHLAKFVRVSREKIKKEVAEELESVGIANEKDINRITEKRLKKEIKDGIQTFLYQTNTLCSGTGQAAFLSVGCWLSEDEEYSEDLILVFEEMIRQRIQGMRQEDGTYLNPNFPKILYFLDKNTMEGGKYYNTTKLCAECSAKRLVPDYLSVKKHRELKKVPTCPMGKRIL